MIGYRQASFQQLLVPLGCEKKVSKNLLKQMLIAIISSGLVACAGQSSSENDATAEREPRGSDCIFESTIRDYRVLDESNLVVTAAQRKKYHIQLSRPAYGLNSTWGIGFSSPTSQICSGFSSVVFNGSFETEEIRISSIRALNEPEYENLLIRFGLKEPEKQKIPPPEDIEGAEVEELD